MTSPHVRQADKGFDGFIIELDAKREELRGLSFVRIKLQRSHVLWSGRVYGLRLVQLSVVTVMTKSMLI
jgi:hypothetical protein